MRFFSFNVRARRYIFLHMIYSVLIISWAFFPVYLFSLEFTLIEVGILFSLAGLAEVVLTYLSGKLLDRIPCNYGLAFMDFFSGLSSLIYGWSQNYVHIICGKLVEKGGNIFSPSYQVYENEAYKEDYETIYQYHIMAPEIIQMVAFPILGFLLTYVFCTISAYRSFYVVIGVVDLMVIFYTLKILPRVEPVVSLARDFKLSLPRGLYLLVTAEVLLVFGESVGSQFILVYYILQNLQGTFFTVTIVEAVVSCAIIITTLVTLKWKPETIKTASHGIILMMVYAALMTWAPAVWVILAAYFILSVGHSLWFPRHRTLMMNLIGEERRGEILGTISSLNKLSAVAAPFCASFIALKIYVLAPFGVQLILYVAIAIIYWYVGKIVKSSLQE